MNSGHDSYSAVDIGFAHPALLYRDSAEFVERTGQLVADAVQASRPVLVALPSTNLSLLRASLGGDAQWVRWIDMSEAGGNPGRLLPAVLGAFADRHVNRHVVMIGEPIWDGRRAREYGAAVQHEALINLAFSNRRVTVVCPYATSKLSPATIVDAARTHPELIEAGRLSRSTSYGDPASVAAAAVGPLPDPPGDAAVLVIFDGHDLAKSRTFTKHHGRELGLYGRRLEDLELAVHEAVVNTITHAPGPGTLRMWRRGGSVVCEIHDRGRIDDPLVGRHAPGMDDEHGHGLPMIHQLCDLVHLQTDAVGTVLQLYMDIPQAVTRLE